MKLCSTQWSEAVHERARSRAWKIGLGIVLALLPLLSVASVAQESTAPATRTLPRVRGVSRAPYSHIYMHFLLYQIHLDKAAAEREQQGKDGAWLRDHFQKKLGFSPSEFALIRASAVRLDSKLKANRAQVKTIIENDQAIRLSSPEAPKIIPPELKSLVKQREDLIKNEEAVLDQKLGPDSAAKLQDFLRNEFIRSVRPAPPWGSPPQSRRKAVLP